MNFVSTMEPLLYDTFWLRDQPFWCQLASFLFFLSFCISELTPFFNKMHKGNLVKKGDIEVLGFFFFGRDSQTQNEDNGLMPKGSVILTSYYLVWALKSIFYFISLISDHVNHCIYYLIRGHHGCDHALYGVGFIATYAINANHH